MASNALSMITDAYMTQQGQQAAQVATPILQAFSQLQQPPAQGSASDSQAQAGAAPTQVAPMPASIPDLFARPVQTLAPQEPAPTQETPQLPPMPAPAAGPPAFNPQAMMLMQALQHAAAVPGGIMSWLPQLGVEGPVSPRPWFPTPLNAVAAGMGGPMAPGGMPVQQALAQAFENLAPELQNLAPVSSLFNDPLGQAGIQGVPWQAWSNGGFVPNTGAINPAIQAIAQLLGGAGAA